MGYNARNDEIRDNIPRMTTRLTRFALAVVVAMFVAPGTTSAQNKCTADHQRLCRQHHAECIKKPGSTQYGCCMAYSTCLTRGFCPSLTCKKRSVLNAAGRAVGHWTTTRGTNRVYLNSHRALNDNEYHRSTARFQSDRNCCFINLISH